MGLGCPSSSYFKRREPIPILSGASRLELIVFACHHFLGSFHGNGGISAVGIGADGLSKSLIERRATDQDNVLVVFLTLYHISKIACEYLQIEARKRTCS